MSGPSAETSVTSLESRHRSEAFRETKRSGRRRGALARCGQPVLWRRFLGCCVLAVVAGCSGMTTPQAARRGAALSGQLRSNDVSPEPEVAEARESSSGPQTRQAVPEPEPVDPGPPVTNIWVEEDLRAVLRDISAQTGVVIIPDSTVEGVVSLEAEDMPLEECLDRIVETGPWGYKKVRDASACYYVFGSTAPGSRLVDILGETKRIKLNYATATEVHALLPGSLARYVCVGKETNTLAVTAPEPTFSRILTHIAQLDVPPKQVVVEALVVQLSEKGRKELGIDWQWQENRAAAGFDLLVGTFTYSAASELAQEVRVTLKALILKEEAKVLANPRLAALDRQQASIHVGEEKYYTLLSGYTDRPYYTLQSIKAGVTLKITPYIGENREITLTIEPEVSEVATNWDSNGNNLPLINRRTATTTVRVTDGQTIIIGGLLHEETVKAIQKVPLLGDIPLLGFAFRKTKNTTLQSEVVIFITPHLITDAYAAKSQNEKMRWLSQP